MCFSLTGDLEDESILLTNKLYSAVKPSPSDTSDASHAVSEVNQITVPEAVVALLCIHWKPLKCHSQCHHIGTTSKPSFWVNNNLCIKVFLGSFIPGDTGNTLILDQRQHVDMDKKLLGASCQIAHDHMHPYNSPIRTSFLDKTS